MNMNKFALVLTIVFLILTIYFAIFNWNVFVLNLDVNVGFQIIQLPLVATIFAVGITFLALQWLVTLLNELNLQKKISKKTEEVNSLKYGSTFPIEENFASLSNKMEELLGKVNNLIDKPKEEV